MQRFYVRTDGRTDTCPGKVDKTSWSPSTPTPFVEVSNFLCLYLVFLFAASGASSGVRDCKLLRHLQGEGHQRMTPPIADSLLSYEVRTSTPGRYAARRRPNVTSPGVCGTTTHPRFLCAYAHTCMYVRDACVFSFAVYFPGRKRATATTTVRRVGPTLLRAFVF